MCAYVGHTESTSASLPFYFQFSSSKFLHTQYTQRLLVLTLEFETEGKSERELGKNFPTLT